jgi:anthranilate synthase/phosphoribosyltransferase
LPANQKGKRIATILDTLAEGHDLSAEMASTAFGALMDGAMTPAQAGAFLIALRAKGETATELNCAIKTGLNRAVSVPNIKGKAIDIVGTGGDGKSSFNCSTLTALTMAGMGYKVIKHGNRAVSSTSGAADAVEALGLPLDLKPEQVAPTLAKRNFAFLFAPNYHPAFRNVGPVRRELGVRTIFNLLGPLLNPAQPSHILLGVARPELLDLISDTLLNSHFETAAVIHGAGGYDELTPIGPSTAIIVKGGKKERLVIDPADYGMPSCTEEELAVHTKEDATRVLHEILSGHGSEAMKNMVILNLALSLYIIEDHSELSTCVARAKEAVNSGVGRRVIDVA